mgnify:CR=1 FL=1
MRIEANDETVLKLQLRLAQLERNERCQDLGEARNGQCCVAGDVTWTGFSIAVTYKWVPVSIERTATIVL